MSGNAQFQIPERELLAYRAEIRGDIFRQIHRKLAELKPSGLTQKKMAQRLGMNEGQLSRILQGKNDLRLETLSDLARALDCRIVSQLNSLQLKAIAHEDIKASNVLLLEAPDDPASAERVRNLEFLDAGSTPRIHLPAQAA